MLRNAGERGLLEQFPAVLVAIAFGATCLNAVGFYLILSYMPTHLSQNIGLSETASYVATTVALATYEALCGWLRSSLCT